MLNGGFSLGFAWTDVDIDPEELIDHANERMLLGKRRYYEQTVSSSHNPVSYTHLATASSRYFSA